ncbi:MAG: hypothetical protein Kow0010_03360 [Dehalococcoidia bacterium]
MIRWSRVSPLVAQVAVMCAAGLVVGAVGLASRYWTLQANEAAFHALEDATRVENVLHHTENARALLEQARSDLAGDRPFPAVVAIEANLELDEARYAAWELNRFRDAGQADEILGHLEEAELALLAAVDTGGAGDLEVSFQHLDAAMAGADALRPVLIDRVASQKQRASQVANWAFVITIAVGLAGAAVVLTLTAVIGRQMRAAAERERARSASLEQATRVLERRNGQFRALYQIVTEINETLSLRYVVTTALREGRRLMNADVAVLRLLRGERLEVAGVESDGLALALGDVPLGEGLAGRAAKRGRLARVDDDAAAQMIAPELVPGARSGVVAPLIVGARVVGTIEVWSRAPALFDEDDAQVLEMMASQVASAVVAADTHEATAHEARHDPLTGVPNRRQLHHDIVHDIQPHIDTAGRMAVVMIDIDHFKQFNDEHGHRVGDIALQLVAKTLRTALRQEDRLYRYGGEEFCAVLSDVTADDALRLVERLRTAVAALPLTGPELAPIGPVTISAGVACAPGDGSTVDELIARADRALYVAKRQGRNRVVLFEPSMEESAAA